MWVDVNSRVNYPLKHALNELVQNGEINFSSLETKYAVSCMTCRVAKVGVKRFVEAGNHHSIPKKGRPIKIMKSKSKTM